MEKIKTNNDESNTVEIHHSGKTLILYCNFLLKLLVKISNPEHIIFIK